MTLTKNAILSKEFLLLPYFSSYEVFVCFFKNSNCSHRIIFNFILLKFVIMEQHINSNSHFTFQKIKSLQQHKNRVHCLCVWDQSICSGSYDSTICIWDADGNHLQTLKGHTGSVWSLCVWNSQLCSGGGRGNTIRIWNSTGECVNVLKEHTSAVWSLVTWNNNLVSSSDDKTIKIWNSKGTVIQTLQEHTGTVYCLIIWNNLICSGSSDATIKIWNSSSGTSLHTLQGHSMIVRVFVFGMKNSVVDLSINPSKFGIHPLNASKLFKHHRSK